MNEDLNELLSLLLQATNLNNAVETAAKIIFDCQEQAELHQEQNAFYQPTYH